MERITVPSRKMMATIIWHPTRFHRIIVLPKRIKFNADYCVSHILDPLAEWRRSHAGASNRRLHVHADNAGSQTAKKITKSLASNGMKRAPHPPYSPVLEPCDFDFFGYVKGRLAGASFEDPDQLLHAIDAIFQSIEKATLERTFREWTDRLAHGCVAVGDLVEGT
jgi:transposase